MEARDPRQTVHPTLTSRSRTGQGTRLIAALVGLAFAAAACTSVSPHGSSTSAPHGSSTSSTSGSSGGSVANPSGGVSVSSSSGGHDSVNIAQVLRYWLCMQSHGEGGSPPHLVYGTNGSMGFMSPLSASFDPQSPTFVAAQQDCKQYDPLTGTMTPAEQVQNVAQELKFARCMRAHGVLGFPDPSSDGSLTIPDSVDDNSSTFQGADRACERELTGGSG